GAKGGADRPPAPCGRQRGTPWGAVRGPSLVGLPPRSCSPPPTPRPAVQAELADRLESIQPGLGEVAARLQFKPPKPRRHRAGRGVHEAGQTAHNPKGNG